MSAAHTLRLGGWATPDANLKLKKKATKKIWAEILKKVF